MRKTLKSFMKRSLKTLGVVSVLSNTATATAQETTTEGEKAGFFKQAFRDMKESAKQQREIDRANFKAQKMETKAFYEEQKTLSSPSTRKAMQESEYRKQLADAKARQEAAEKRISEAKANR